MTAFVLPTNQSCWHTSTRTYVTTRISNSMYGIMECGYGLLVYIALLLWRPAEHIVLHDESHNYCRSREHLAIWIGIVLRGREGLYIVQKWCWWRWSWLSTINWSAMWAGAYLLTYLLFVNTVICWRTNQSISLLIIYLQFLWSIKKPNVPWTTNTPTPPLKDKTVEYSCDHRASSSGVS